MATFRRLEEIEAWVKARHYTNRIYRETRIGEFARDYGFRDQTRRAAVSIMANIAEGFGRNSDKEFANFLNIAIGSSSESLSHLYIAFDQKYIEQKTFVELCSSVREISCMCKSLAQNLRNRQ